MRKAEINSGQQHSSTILGDKFPAATKGLRLIQQRGLRRVRARGALRLGTQGAGYDSQWYRGEALAVRDRGQEEMTRAWKW